MSLVAMWRVGSFRVKRAVCYAIGWTFRPREREYPQTWWWVGRRLKPVARWLCEHTGGHELSKTEWGYCGGRYTDRWCRWCNAMVSIPKEEVDRTPNMEEFMPLIDDPENHPFPDPLL